MVSIGERKLEIKHNEVTNELLVSIEDITGKTDAQFIVLKEAGALQILKYLESIYKK